MRILVDMDGIVADLLSKWLKVYNVEWGDDLTVDRITHYDLARSVKPACDEQVYEIIKRARFFDDLEPMPGAAGALRQFRDKGHAVRFATAAVGPDSARAKLGWAERVFCMEPSEVFIGHDKHWIDADVLIDDKPDTIRMWKQLRAGAAAMTIAYPYNQDIKDVADVYADDWRDPRAAWSTIVDGLNEIVGESRPDDARWPVHYDSLPHGSCPDPEHCDCDCSQCLSARGQAPLLCITCRRDHEHSPGRCRDENCSVCRETPWSGCLVPGRCIACGGAVSS